MPYFNTKNFAELMEIRALKAEQGRLEWKLKEREEEEKRRSEVQSEIAELKRDILSKTFQLTSKRIF